MTALEAFSRNAAQRFLQSVVFVDDEIYVHASGKPVDISSDAEGLKPLGSQFSQKPVVDAAVVADDATQEAVPYHPKQMVESFAKKGIVCALYEPEKSFQTDANSELFKLCDRADIVILDWDLYGRAGENILPLIANLVDAGQSSVPHHVRLCVLYTATPDLVKVANEIYSDLRKKLNAKIDVLNATTIVAGASRLVVLGKPSVPGRPEASKLLEVKELELADRVVDEFAKMNSGLLASYAIHGMAGVRRNTKRILDKFGAELDGPFLVHRALTLESEDSFDQLPELLSEEVFAIIQDMQIPHANKSELAGALAETIALDATKVSFNTRDGKNAQQASLPRRFLAGGRQSIVEDCKFSKKWIPNLHSALGCSTTLGEKKLATLFNTRTRYEKADSKITLGLGSIVRYKKDNSDIWSFAFCLMPICDGIRLKKSDAGTTFPFWDLVPAAASPKGRGIMVEYPKGEFLHLVANGKPSEMLWTCAFHPAEEGAVCARVTEDGRHVFDGGREIEWIAQTKPAHAQRVAYDIGQKLSRVGLMEAEWLRLVSGEDEP